jgi:hypothetical protein
MPPTRINADLALVNELFREFSKKYNHSYFMDMRYI